MAETVHPTDLPLLTTAGVCIVSERGLPVSDGVFLDAQFRPSLEEIKQPDRPKLRDVLGPGLITGASDDDPSGIATYSQAGAQYGYSLGWTLLLTYPLMCAIQMISAQIGRVTGRGLAGKHRPRSRSSKRRSRPPGSLRAFSSIRSSAWAFQTS
jgi:Natural resistance-associated macrophage protein